MSSGFNGIGIRSVGKTRWKLAELLTKETGVLVEAHNISRTNPWHRKWEDCVAWGCYGNRNGQRIHIFCWDTMTECVKRGVEIVPDHRNNSWEIEVCAK